MDCIIIYNFDRSPGTESILHTNYRPTKDHTSGTSEPRLICGENKLFRDKQYLDVFTRNMPLCLDIGGIGVRPSAGMFGSMVFWVSLLLPTSLGMLNVEIWYAELQRSALHLWFFK